MIKTKLYNLIRRLSSFFFLALALLYLIYLSKEKLIDLDFGLLKTTLLVRPEILILIILLTLINWWLEISKWRYLTLFFQKVTWSQSIKSILVGLIAGLFTPNRIGELGGRLIYIKKDNRSRALYVNSICSISQLFVTVSFGLVGCLYLVDYLLEFIKIEQWLLKLLIFSTLGFLLILYLKSDLIRKTVSKVERKLKFKNLEEVISFSFNQRLRVLIFSIFRYIVFCTQFVLFVIIVDPTASFLILFFIISVIFLVMAIIPTGWLSDLPIRTSVFFTFFEFFELNGSYGIMASICLWFLNLFLPSLFGLLLYKEVYKNLIRR